MVDSWSAKTYRSSSRANSSSRRSRPKRRQVSWPRAGRTAQLVCSPDRLTGSAGVGTTRESSSGNLYVKRHLSARRRAAVYVVNSVEFDLVIQRAEAEYEHQQHAENATAGRLQAGRARCVGDAVSAVVVRDERSDECPPEQQ